MKIWVGIFSILSSLVVIACASRPPNIIQEYPAKWPAVSKDISSECPDISGSYENWVTGVSSGRATYEGALDQNCELLFLEEFKESAYLYSCLLGKIFSTASKSRTITSVDETYVRSSQMSIERQRKVRLTQKPGTLSVSLLDEGAVVEEYGFNMENDDFSCEEGSIVFSQTWKTPGKSGHIRNTFNVAEDGSLIMKGIVFINREGVVGQFWNRWGKHE